MRNCFSVPRPRVRKLALSASFSGGEKTSPMSHSPEEKIGCLIEPTEVGSKALKLILQTKTSLSSVELCVRETRVDIIVLSLY